MTGRGFTALICGGIAVFTALCVGSRTLLIIGLLLLLLLGLGLISILPVSRTLTLQSDQAGRVVRRGDEAGVQVTFFCRLLLPVAPLRVSAPDPVSGKGLCFHEVTLRRRAPGVLSLPFHAAHVGVCASGVQDIEIRDLFGFFSRHKKPDHALQELLVLPNTFEVEDMPLAIGDSVMESVARATEDVTNPTDIREYQPGDALKKIHWKLSARKQELVVRRFEEPVMPDTLVLIDCSAPPAIGHPEAEADLRDALLETAASVMAREIRQEHSPRMPLLGKHPIECEKSMGPEMIAENLARVDFSQVDRFDRVLLLESRRMRRVGATIAIAPRLNGRIVDALTSLRRMGPYVRLYLVTFTPDDPQLLPFVSRLQHVGVEVRYVTPNPV